MGCGGRSAMGWGRSAVGCGGRSAMGWGRSAVASPLGWHIGGASSGVEQKLGAPTPENRPGGTHFALGCWDHT